MGRSNISPTWVCESITWRTTSSDNVAVPGASCQVGPSSSSKTHRLEGLRAAGPGALSELLEKLPEPPWDAVISVDDPLIGWLTAAGFEPYRQMATVVRPLDGLPPAPHIAGIRLEVYRNQMAETFQQAEREALADSPAFRELGQPTGYEGAEGFDAFVVARKEERVVGFAQAQLPEGWINWMGVVPDQRRRGIGRALVSAVAKAVANARGTHVGMETDETPEALAFWRALGFRTTGRQVALIRRAT